MMFRYPKELLMLITLLKKLGGVGQTTAERYAFQLLNWEDKDLKILGDTIAELKIKINFCSICGCIMENNHCFFCDDPTRNKNIICIISSPKEAYAIEQTKSFNGLYHVITHLISPLVGLEETGLNLNQLLRRIKNNSTIKEIIIALDSTLEGDATSLHLKKELAPFSLTISRLAFGIPMGSPLEYIDKGTLTQALCGRQLF